MQNKKENPLTIYVSNFEIERLRHTIKDLDSPETLYDFFTGFCGIDFKIDGSAEESRLYELPRSLSFDVLMKLFLHRNINLLNEGVTRRNICADIVEDHLFYTLSVGICFSKFAKENLKIKFLRNDKNILNRFSNALIEMVKKLEED